MTMLLLPILAGLTLVLQGPGVHVLGARNAAASELDDYNNLIDRIFRIKQLLREQKRHQENEDNIPQNRYSGNEKVTYQEEPIGNSIKELNLAGDPPSEDGGADPTPTVPPPTVTSTTVKVHEQPPQPQAHIQPASHSSGILIPKNNFVFIMVVSACSVAGLVGLIMAGVCWYRLHTRVKAASDVDYPAYGVTGPTKERLPSPGDRKLAQSAQMYHYQHQKQQMIAMEKASGEMKHDASEDESEEENEEGDYTVYECPGLAPTGEMEVRNPLFNEEAQTPRNGQPPVVNGITDGGEDLHQ